MKPIRFSRILAAAALLGSVAAHAGSTPATTTTTTSGAESASLPNWVTFSLGGAFVSGDEAAMRQRTRTNGQAVYGGISDFSYTQPVGSATLTMDGHALPGMEDYEGNISLTKDGLGYVKAGYNQFRTWYDGSGGWRAGAQYNPYPNDDLHIDRRTVNFEAGLRMENLPEVTFKYRHASRNGGKDSLTWGEGYPSGVANSYKLMPAWWSISEYSDIFDLSATYAIGITELEGGVVYEHQRYTDSRTNQRGNTLSGSGGYRQAQMTDKFSSDIWASHVSSVTRFNDKLWLSAAFAYNTLDTDTNGSSRSFSSPLAAVIPTDSSYNNFTGGGQTHQTIGNVSIMWVPVADLTITPSFRIEHEDTSAWSSFRNFNPATKVISSVPTYASSHNTDSNTTAIDIRYTGIEDLVLYGKAEVGHESEDVDITQVNYANNWLREDVTVNEQEYSAGANWYPLSGLSFSLQGFYADRRQSFDDTGIRAAGATTIRPIMLDHQTETRDLNARITWRPATCLTLVSRYDYCWTDYTVGGSSWTPAIGAVSSVPAANTLLQVGSGQVRSHIFSESATWSPLNRMYLYGNISWVTSHTDTATYAYNPNSDSDYLAASASMGYAIDDRTEIALTYAYYGCSDYAALAGSMGYGYDTDENAVSVTLTRALTDNIIWNVGYTYYCTNTNGADQTGGFNDFTAHMVSTGLQVRF